MACLNTLNTCVYTSGELQGRQWSEHSTVDELEMVGRNKAWFVHVCVCVCV